MASSEEMHFADESRSFMAQFRKDMWDKHPYGYNTGYGNTILPLPQTSEELDTIISRFLEEFHSLKEYQELFSSPFSTEKINDVKTIMITKGYDFV